MTSATLSSGDTAPRPVLILGMHRSGTSCLAGMMEEAGLFLGDVNTSAPFNRKGNREFRPAMELHDRVLADAGGAWDRPPANPVQWSRLRLEELESLVATYPADRVWGLKDPRLLLLMEGWRTITSPRCVATFRHPAAVVNSLLARAEAWGRPMRSSKALDLWLAYNERLLCEHDRAPFPVIRYDQSESDYRDKVLMVARELGLAPSADPVFRQSDLTHFDGSGVPPDRVRSVWERLNDIAI